MSHPVAMLVDWFRRLRTDYKPGRLDYEPGRLAAEALVAEETARVRRLAYDDLKTMVDKPIHAEAFMPDGEAVCLETQVMWDGRRGGDLRVIVDLWRPSAPNPPLAKDDFIRSPDGSFVDE